MTVAGYPSTPPNGVGGDGRGVGSPATSVSQTVHAVRDLGLDPFGSEPINDTIEGLSSGTEVVFPEGRFLVEPTNNVGASLDTSDVWLHGHAENGWDATRFVMDGGKAGIGFTCTGNRVAISNVTFDHSNHDATVFGLYAGGSGNKYFYNVRHVGTNLPPASCGSPLVPDDDGRSQGVTIDMDAGSHCHIENYVWRDPEFKINPAPDGFVGIRAIDTHAGTAAVVNSHVAWRSEGGVDASECPGELNIDGGYYHNSCRANVILSGSASTVENAVIHSSLTDDRAEISEGGKPAVNIHWLPGEEGAAGLIQNTTIITDEEATDLADTRSVVVSQGATGVSIKDAVIRHDDNASACTVVLADGGLIQNSSFTGSSGRRGVYGWGDTKILDCCVALPGGMEDCVVRGLSTNECRVATKNGN